MASNTNHREQQQCRQQERRAGMQQRMQLCHVSSRGSGQPAAGEASAASLWQEQSPNTLQQG